MADPGRRNEHEDKSPRKHRPSNFRSQYRARAHESAHADAGAANQDLPAPTDLPGVPQGPASIIDTNEDLAKLIDDLRRDGSFAYDSEFIGELTYRPQLCLLQVASRDRIALIDPLADLELTPFWQLLADESVAKIVHAGEQDIEPVVRHLNRPAANVFDTQIAAGFVALPYPMSLSKIVLEMTGVKLGKGLTFSHWDQRPLSAIQLRYAADDVRYLPAAADEILRRLDARGHTAWAWEECQRVCAPDLYRFDPETQYLRVRGATSLQPKNLAVLRELTIWRDSEARRQDLPPRTFLRDEILLDLARNPVTSPEKLSKVRGLPRPVEEDNGADITAAIQRALSLPPVQWPGQREVEPTPPEKFRADAVCSAAQVICAGLGIDPMLVASKQDMSDFFRYVSSGQKGEMPRILVGWRKAAVGDLLLDFIAGKRHVTLDWREQELRLKR